MLDQAFDALKTSDWGQDRVVLDPIEEAVVATHGDAGRRKELSRVQCHLSDDPRKRYSGELAPGDHIVDVRRVVLSTGRQRVAVIAQLNR